MNLACGSDCVNVSLVSSMPSEMRIRAVEHPALRIPTNDIPDINDFVDGTYILFSQFSE